MFNKYKKLYPIALSMVEERPKLVEEIFVKLAPHKGVYIGVCILDGSFMCDSPGELFSSLEQGEKLRIVYKDEFKNKNYRPLEVQREDGTYVGVIPLVNSIVPNIVLARGLKTWCHLEAKEFNAGMLSFAVSIYCEDY